MHPVKSKKIRETVQSGLMFMKAKKVDTIQTDHKDAQIESLQQYTDYHRAREEG